MIDKLRELTDNDGRLIIKDQGGRLLLASEVLMDGRTFAVGIPVSSIEDLIDKLPLFIKHTLAGIERLKTRLEIA